MTLPQKEEGRNCGQTFENGQAIPDLVCVNTKSATTPNNVSFPQTDEHTCVNCALKVPTCGNKRRVKEGYCTKFEASVGVKK